MHECLINSYLKAVAKLRSNLWLHVTLEEASLIKCLCLFFLYQRPWDEQFWSEWSPTYIPSLLSMLFINGG